MNATAVTVPTLARTLTPLQLFAIAFGSIIGIGWITLVGVWLQSAGPYGAALGFGLGCAAVLLIALAYAELALLVPRAGGEVAYAQEAFGPGAAFAVGWLLLMVYAAVIAFEMISIGWVVSTIWPEARGPVTWSIDGRPTHLGELAAGGATMVLVTFANLRAAGLAARGQVVLMALKIGVSVLFIVAAFVRGDPRNLAPGFAGGSLALTPGILAVFAVSLLFYGGFNFLPQGIEERAEQVRPAQIVRAMLVSLVCACAFYILVILATALVLPRGQLFGLELPAAAAFEIAFQSRTLRNLVLIAGLLGLITAWNGTLFAAGRIVLILGRQGLLPPAFARLSERGRTPTLGLLGVTALAAGLGLSGRAAVEPIVIVAATCIPLAWVMVTAAAIRLRLRQPAAERAFRAPGGNAVFGVGLMCSLLAFVVAARDVLGAQGGAALGGIALVGWLVLGLVVWKFRS